MTRQEEILNKAIDYSEIKENFLEYDDCGDVCDDKLFIEKAFIEGAKWADETHGKELMYVIQKTGERTKREVINKACEYLESSLKYDLGYHGAADFADTFKKAMEE